MMSGLFALIQALPVFLTLLSRLGNILASFVSYAETNNLNGWIDDLEHKIDALKKAQTPEDKLNAAQGLASVIRDLGPH